jgi:hypothetical protein
VPTGSIHSLAVLRGVALLACLAGVLACSAGPASAGPLTTAVVDPASFGSSGQAQAFARTRAVGATMVRILLNWSDVAPSQRPSSFNPQDPNDPAYQWGPVDGQLEAAVAAGLAPVVTIQYAPRWAEGAGSGRPGTVRPDPDQFGLFARAAAERYSGRFDPDPFGNLEPLPRVRYWQAWNEPNRDYFLMPQYQNGRVVSGDWYRRMVAKFAAAVHAVDPANVVVAGGLAPLQRPTKPGPMAFMRSMLCMSTRLHRTCDLRPNPVNFDAWSHHPYTSGGPTHRAPGRDDVSLGDLPKMRRLLRAAIRAGQVVSARRVGFWVTEFSWDSSPPDPRALRARLHARWVSEALYRMWKNGVSVVTWYRIADDALRTSQYQSGFYRTNGRRKLSFTAFRFPVVAFTRRGGIYVWGRTAAGQQGRVAIQLKAGRRWRALGSRRTNGYGIFFGTYRTPVRRGFVRARFGSEVSVPFSLTPAADRYVNPFGCGGPIPC